MSETAPAPYQVLARKYRPSSFDDLIGQEPMVRTLRNAFTSGRIAHAWMLTGVRGVGKTTTARILARALNFVREDGTGEPTVDLTEEGVHCRAIMEGRHPDVIEMDAASHTGIDDIRDIIDSARYSPVSARFKVYIIDEVHMLSKAAFNGLLKTLEEPPAHVKFVFATTEIRKVPVTVLSRCQRFDLRRIEASTLMQLLGNIAAKEGIEVDTEALRAIARAGEGSARDSLSILDQAIAHGGGRVDADTVHDMLGLADRARTIDLFEHVMRGDTAAAMAELKAQHDTGADPVVVLTDLAEFTHYVTRLKLAPQAAADASATESERTRGQIFAESLSVRILSRTWQMLLKGIAETQTAPRPMLAADMVLVRLCHAADMPTPDEAIRLLQSGEFGGAVPGGGIPARGGASRPASPGQSSAQSVSQPASMPSASVPSGAPVALVHSQRGAGMAARAEAQPAQSVPQLVPQMLPQRAPEPAKPQFLRFEDVIEKARAERDRLLVFALERHVRPVRFEPGQLEITLTPDADPGLPQKIGETLREWTGQRWIVAVSSEGARDTFHEVRLKRRATLLEEAKADPLVQEVLSRFPGAQIVEVREALPPEPVPDGETPNPGGSDAGFDDGYADDSNDD
ncbi:DNA polymerase III, tau subunit [Faunimonas pinastri]|uniref:DNA polymerase III subunit gamma/tau n=1 Tax=Faunimonas pinastri TaxID=1855383 RepID=A0A1H9HGL5_9HYPH|nr:DNA polymerase III subunit gamma/tau [Faunimonas pinastri]SEQ61469.1 DNA polymerase III, tau subunit [Faunimonas pinastri]